MVARLDFWSVNLAQKPKSAVDLLVQGGCEYGKSELTDFDFALGVEEDVVGFDITMDDGLTVEMAQAFARLTNS